MKKVEIAYSPELAKSYELEGKLVVVVDIYRATSTMVTAFANGVEEIVPCATVEKCLSHRPNGYFLAGERNGVKLEAFDYGNSPFAFVDNSLVTGVKLAMTTTNGTKAIKESTPADEIIIGAFLNLSAVIAYCNNSMKDIVVVCAGWKGTPSIEDSLFAAHLVRGLEKADVSSDSCVQALALLKLSDHDLLKTCEHAKRLKQLGMQEDIEYCIQKDIHTVVPRIESGVILSF